MKKKVIIILSVVLLVLIGLLFVFLKDGNKSGIEFKNKYESVNGTKNSHGSENRTISIDKDNPFIEITPSELIKKIDNEETFFVYFGDELCPWCRSVIEVATKVAKDNGVSDIYYIDIWDDKGNEIFRDKYKLNDDKELEKVSNGTEEYFTILKKFDDVLSDYTLTSGDDKISANEKRIYAPNFVFVNNGKAEKLVEGMSDKQKNPYEELTDEIILDENLIFDDFFSSGNMCSTESSC